jgi:hypothetical protein
MSSPFISHDKKYVGIIRTESQDNYKSAANYGRFPDGYQKQQTLVGAIVNLDGSGARDVVRDQTGATTSSFPRSTARGLFCHEGPGTRPHQASWLDKPRRLRIVPASVRARTLRGLMS